MAKKKVTDTIVEVRVNGAKVNSKDTPVYSEILSDGTIVLSTVIGSKVQQTLEIKMTEYADQEET